MLLLRVKLTWSMDCVTGTWHLCQHSVTGCQAEGPGLQHNRECMSGAENAQSTVLRVPFRKHSLRHQLKRGCSPHQHTTHPQ